MNKLSIIIIGVALLVLLCAILNDLHKNKKAKRDKFLKWNVIAAYCFLIPAIVGIIIFVIQPIVMSIVYAFTDYYLLDPNNIQFVGLKNFGILWKDFMEKGDFYNAVKNTLHFMVFAVPLQVSLALFLAILVNRNIKGIMFYKIAFFAPVILSLAVISILWTTLLRPDDLGLINNFLMMFGMEPQKFLQDPNMAMNLIVMISVWQGAGFQMLIFLSALKNIPTDQLEAASLEGANKWQEFIYITIPSIKPQFVFVLITVFIGASKLMTQPMIMIGYKDYSVTMSYFIYQEGYFFKMVGYASAAALIMSIIIGAVTLAQRYLFRGEE